MLIKNFAVTLAHIKFELILIQTIAKEMHNSLKIIVCAHIAI